MVAGEVYTWLDVCTLAPFTSSVKVESSSLPLTTTSRTLVTVLSTRSPKPFHASTSMSELGGVLCYCDREFDHLVAVSSKLIECGFCPA